MATPRHAAFALLLIVTGAQADVPSAGSSFAMRLQNSANSTNRGSGDLLFWGLFDPVPPASQPGATVWSFTSQCPLNTTCSLSVSGAGWVRQRILERDFSVGELQYYASRAYNPSLVGPWSIWLSTDAAFTSGTNKVIATPGVGDVAAMPYVQSLALQSTGLTPTVSWSLPGSTASIDQVLVRVFDNAKPITSISRTPNSPHTTQQSDLIFSQKVSVGSSFTLPANLLQYGNSYSVAVVLDHLRPDQSVVSRSQSFFDYTPINPATLVGAPSNIVLPTMDPISNLTGPEQGPLYRFHVDAVSPDALTYIDPAYASGFEYRIGAGDPNFKSVQIASLLGDGLYEVYTWTGSGWTLARTGLAAGERYEFGTGGVDRFQIRGIEASAEVSAFDPSAFVTGVSFTAHGSFTGTMQAMVAVPEPATIALWCGGLTLLALRRRPGVRAEQR